MGAVTSIGKNINEFKDSLFNGRCGISLLEGMDKFGELTVKVGGQVKNFNPVELGMDPGHQEWYCMLLSISHRTG